MKKILFIAGLLCTTVLVFSQKVERPKLVVGIVVDQMRWDFLYRFYDRYAPTGGFKRLMNMGFNCNNTMIPYVPTYTACGHSCIYTGSLPAITGITGNEWYDNDKKNYVYCTADSSVNTVGSITTAGKMSPKNMLTTTICDELKLATNFRSKVIGIALKDRGGILAAGHSANATYWYDPKVGQWITSSYYMNELPAWVTSFNNQKLVDKYYMQGWKTLYPINSYIQSTADTNNYEVKSFGKGFPYDLSSLVGKNYSPVIATPYGNTLTSEFAKESIDKEKLGMDSITDFLAISYSSTDYVGHSFGPNSIEIEDTYLRLDAELGSMLDYLDTKVGKNQYLVFLSADHGVAHVPAFMKDNKLPAGNLVVNTLVDTLNLRLKEKFGVENLIIDLINHQVVLNIPAITGNSRLVLNDIKHWVIQYLLKQEAVMDAFALDELQNTTLPAIQKEMIANGFYARRCGQIYVVFKPQWLEGFEKGGTTHGLWNPYDAHIPLLWYGWSVKPGTTYRDIYMTDIAATLAALLKIQMPNGSVGKVITELFR